MISNLRFSLLTMICWYIAWRRQCKCEAVNCFSNIARVNYSMVTSHLHLHLHLPLSNWYILYRHHTNQLARKVRRLYEGLRTVVIKKRARNILQWYKFSATILAAVWTVCWGASEEKRNERAMITLHQLKTNANAGLPIWLPLMLFRVVTACVEMSPLRVP